MKDFDSWFSILTNDHDQMTAIAVDNWQLKIDNFSLTNIREPQSKCRTFAVSIWKKKIARPREKFYGPTGEAIFPIEMRRERELIINYQLSIKKLWHWK